MTYRDIFGVDPEPEANKYQDALHEVAARKESAAANLRLQAAINQRYAQANRDTHANTGGRLGSLRMADIHDAYADLKLAQADRLFPPDNTAEYDSTGQSIGKGG